MEAQIGIAITTVPSRADMHDKQMEFIGKHTPDTTFIYVHNDIRSIGVARSKNNCLKALYEAGCTHFFLLDDDVWPAKDGWLDVFIQSDLNHACPTFDKFDDGRPTGHVLMRTYGGVEYWSKGCGMILYYTRETIDSCGGMDIRYGLYSYEHGGFSQRISNTGLVRHAYCSPVGALDYFYVSDYFRAAPSTVEGKKRADCRIQNERIFKEESMSRGWKPFRKANYVLSALYTKARDEQRGNKLLGGDLSRVQTLLNSCPCELVLWSDLGLDQAFKGHMIYSSVPKNISAYNWRFIEWYKWLVTYREYCEVVYLLDASDTEFIGEPHEIKRGEVYVNTEGHGGLGWLIQKSGKYKARFRDLLSARGNDIWNCGVIYGHVDDVIKLLEAMQRYLACDSLMDMPAINIVCNQGLPGIKFVAVKSGFKIADKSGVYIRHK